MNYSQIHDRDVATLARGAAILGTGGGGDPHIGSLMAQHALAERGPVELADPLTLPDDAVVVPVAMMGAPTVMVEKLPNVDQFAAAIEALADYLNLRPTHVACMEAGGVNSTIPLVAAAQLGLPLVDGDAMGRAFPELQMVLPTLYGIAATPMAMTDDKGNRGVFDTVTNAWAERLARITTVEMGCTAIVSLYSMNGAQVRESFVPHTLSLCLDLGHEIDLARAGHHDPVAAVIARLGGRLVAHGKVTDVVRRTEAGFARGTARIEGVDGDAGTVVELSFQNEHLMASLDGRVEVTTPDLIIALDAETAEPVTTESLRFGHRLAVVAAPCDHRWHSPGGLELVGPEYFGYPGPAVRWDGSTADDGGAD